MSFIWSVANNCETEFNKQGTNLPQNPYTSNNKCPSKKHCCDLFNYECILAGESETILLYRFFSFVLWLRGERKDGQSEHSPSWINFEYLFILIPSMFDPVLCRVREFLSPSTWVVTLTQNTVKIWTLASTNPALNIALMLSCDHRALSSIKASETNEQKTTLLSSKFAFLSTRKHQCPGPGRTAQWLGKLAAMLLWFSFWWKSSWKGLLAWDTGLQFQLPSGWTLWKTCSPGRILM